MTILTDSNNILVYTGQFVKMPKCLNVGRVSTDYSKTMMVWSQLPIFIVIFHIMVVSEKKLKYGIKAIILHLKIIAGFIFCRPDKYNRIHPKICKCLYN